MATKAFTKGEKATFIQSWDNKGTFYFVQVVVYSCGAKQMVLTDEVSGKEIGRHFAPEVANVESLHYFNWGGTFKRMTDEAAEALCLELGAKLPAAIVVENERRNEHNAKVGRVTACIIKDECHEPRSRNETGK